LKDHALSLLKTEKAAGKPQADKLIAGLKPRLTAGLEAFNPRTPWLQEPDY